MVKAGAMALKAVVPGIPKCVRDWDLLEEDLRQIGCHWFMERPWGLRIEDMVVEVLGDKDNWWDRTMHQAVGARNNNKRKESTRIREVCSNCQFFWLSRGIFA